MLANIESTNPAYHKRESLDPRQNVLTQTFTCRFRLSGVKGLRGGYAT